MSTMPTSSSSLSPAPTTPRLISTLFLMVLDIQPSFSLRASTTTATTTIFTSPTDHTILLNTSNTTTMVSEEERREYLHRLQADTTITMIPAMTFLSLLAVTGLIGNSLVLFVYSRRFTRTPTRVFILFLACVDLLTNLLVIPGELYDIQHQWDFNNRPLCQARLFLNALTTMTSALVLLGLAVVRYRKVCVPHGWQVTKRHARYANVLITFLSTLFSIPYVILSGRLTRETPRPDIHGYECTTDDSYVSTIWPVLNNGFFLLLFLFSSIPLTVLYTLMGIKAWRHIKVYKTSKAAVARAAARRTCPSPQQSPSSSDAGPQKEVCSRKSSRKPSRDVVESLDKKEKIPDSSFIAESTSNEIEEHGCTSTCEEGDDTIKGAEMHQATTIYPEEGRHQILGVQDRQTVSQSSTSAIGIIEYQEEDKDDKSRQGTGKDHPLTRQHSSHDSSAASVRIHTNTGDKSDDNQLSIFGYNGSGRDTANRNRQTGNFLDNVSDDKGSDIDIKNFNRQTLNFLDDVSDAVQHDIEQHISAQKWMGGSQCCPTEIKGTQTDPGTILHTTSSKDSSLTCHTTSSIMKTHTTTSTTSQSNTKTYAAGSKEGASSRPGGSATSSSFKKDNPPRTRVAEFYLEDTIINEEDGANNETTSPEFSVCDNNDDDKNTRVDTTNRITFSTDNRSKKIGRNGTVTKIKRIVSKAKLLTQGSWRRSGDRRNPLSRTTIMLILISAVYALGFLPYLGLTFFRFIAPEQYAALTRVELSAIYLFMRSYFLNCAANPIIYSLCDINFRRECFRLFKCLSRRR